MKSDAWVVVLGLAAVYFVSQWIDQNSVDQTILDANDAQAQNVDQTILDSNDALAQDGGSGYIPPSDGITDVSFFGAIMKWAESLIPSKYLNAIRTAEQKYALPHDLLARLLYQESRYRDDIISGQLKSSAGAIGIAQFTPATAAWLGVNPYDPIQSIYAAAKYLKALYTQTGTWALALAAYNWGIGNVQKKGLANAPAETKDYYQSILADIGMSPTTA